MAHSDIPLRRIDHVRFFVGNARQSAYFYRNAFGFDVVAYEGLETGVKHEAGYVMRQGNITFVLTSFDRIHGFKMPEFGIRTDIIPDQETRVTITPQKTGSFAFFCDVFCGDGHEDMGGTLIVEA